MDASAAIDEATADLLLTNPAAAADDDLAGVAGFLAELRAAGLVPPPPPRGPVATMLDGHLHPRRPKRLGDS